MDYRKFLIAAGLAAAAAAPAAATPVPATKNDNGKALILIPLTLTKIKDLDFGTVVTSGTSGTVSIDAATGNRQCLGGITCVLSAAGQRAYFGGAGTPGQQVIVVVSPPATGTLDDGNGNSLPVLALTQDNNNNPIRTIDSTHAFFVGVGGIISVAANQPDGDYYATFTVTANYQ